MVYMSNSAGTFYKLVPAVPFLINYQFGRKDILFHPPYVSAHQFLVQYKLWQGLYKNQRSDGVLPFVMQQYPMRIDWMKIPLQIQIFPPDSTAKFLFPHLLL